MARVARLAADSRRKYQPAPQATDDHVVGMVAHDVFTVWIQPDADGSMVTAARLADTGVEHVVIRPRGDSEGRFTVQPLTVDVAGAESVTNLFGSSVDLQGVVATFASDAVRAIAEDADVEVILITTGGEFKCNLDDTRIKRGYDPLDRLWNRVVDLINEDAPALAKPGRRTGLPRARASLRVGRRVIAQRSLTA